MLEVNRNYRDLRHCLVTVVRSRAAYGWTPAVTCSRHQLLTCQRLWNDNGFCQQLAGFSISNDWCISCHGKQWIRDWPPYNGTGEDGESATNIDNERRTKTGYVRTLPSPTAQVCLQSGSIDCIFQTPDVHTCLLTHPRQLPEGNGGGWQRQLRGPRHWAKARRGVAEMRWGSEMELWPLRLFSSHLSLACPGTQRGRMAKVRLYLTRIAFNCTNIQFIAKSQS